MITTNSDSFVSNLTQQTQNFDFQQKYTLKTNRDNNAKVTTVGVGQANKDESEQRLVSIIIPLSEQLSLENDALTTKIFEKEFLRADENTKIVLFFRPHSLVSRPCWLIRQLLLEKWELLTENRNI